MRRIEELFLEAFGASLKGEPVVWEEPLADEEWQRLFEMAWQHHVLPMIYEAVVHCPAAQRSASEKAKNSGGESADVPQGVKGRQKEEEPAEKQDSGQPKGKNSSGPVLPVAAKKHIVLQLVMLQAQKTSEFLAVYRTLREAGLHPLVVKGIVCRSLYPKPDLRISGDEDLLIPPEEFVRCHELLLAQGLTPAEPLADPASACEVSYNRQGGTIYIELHKFLFPPQADAYGDFNRYFQDVHAHPAVCTAEGAELLTLSPTDHLLYLICHALKHFLHSGVGVRQAADIALFANRFGTSVDWLRILACCREIHADLFAAALFRIGEKYLTFDPDAADFPPEWRAVEADESALLADLLDAGAYGDSTMSRKHSSGMTLSAVSAEKQGRKRGQAASLLRTVFPSATALAGRYPYLEKHPALLPAAWISRIAHYRRETAAEKKRREAEEKAKRAAGVQNSKGEGGRTPAEDNRNNAAESMRIGKQRTELLKEYGLLKE